MTLTHINADGRPQMVDISAKQITSRTAQAQAILILPKSVAGQFIDNDLVTKKGSVTHTAIIAGTMAVKKTAELIPFCHPLPIDRCDFNVQLNNSNELVINCTVAVNHKTGVEMEALTGANVAALTVYDMLKALSHDIVISDVRLISKSGGKSDYHCNAENTGEQQ